MNKIIVSISLLTSGKRKELKKCILSILPLMEAVPGELIIVDTGCDEQSRAFIEQYATKIVNFEWCNDFSKARNAGLKVACGKWFLYLDDDEWFEDVAEIIDFFRSGEYTNYDYALYKQRNYEDFEGTKYNDSPVGRMIKLSADTRFIYSIHECFADVGARTKRFSSYVHHYGYVYSNEEEKLNHAKRNLTPLFEEHKKDPKNLRHTLQIMQEYRVLNEYGEINKLGTQAINEYNSQDNEQIFYFNSLLVLTLTAMGHLGQITEMVELGKKLVDHPYIGKLAEAYVCAIMTNGYSELGDLRSQLLYAEKYMVLREEYLTDDSMFIPFETGILAPCFGNEIYRNTLEKGIIAAIKTGNIAQAIGWNCNINWNADKLSVGENLIETIISMLYEKAELSDAEYQMINSALKRDEIADFAREILEERLRDSSQKVAEELVQKCGKIYAHEWFSSLSKEICRMGQQGDSAKNVEYRDADRVTELLQVYAEKQIEWSKRIGCDILQPTHCDPVVGESVGTIIEILQMVEGQNVKGQVEGYKKLLSLRPEWAPAIRICLGALSDSLKRGESSALGEQPRQTQMAMLAGKIKQQVKCLISEEQYPEALQILCQLKHLTPDDMEVSKLLEICQKYKKD